MNSPLVIGIGAGLVSAILFLSTATGSILALGLFFLVALPGFLAGLGWGTRAALVSALTAAVVMSAIGGLMVGALYLGTLGLPVALLCHLLLLARPAEGTAPGGEAALEWYPLGRVIAIVTLMAGAVASLTVLTLGTDEASFREAAKARFDTAIFSHLPGAAGQAIDREKLEPYIEAFVTLLPASSAIIWFGVMLANMWAAARIIELSGRSIRPRPAVAALTYPRAMPLGFVAALLLTFVPGIPRLLATGFSGAFLFAYIVMGLTVLHVVARRSALRPLLLTILYLAMLVFGWVALLVALIGLGEPVLRLRERALPGAKPPDGKGE